MDLDKKRWGRKETIAHTGHSGIYPAYVRK